MQSIYFQSVFSSQTNGMRGYMDGGRLPFDINDFSVSSPKSNEAHIQVINSSSSKENDFNIDDFFKTLMPDTYTPAIQPQPVPPVANSSNYYNSPFQQQQNSSYDQFNQYDANASNTQSNVFSGESNPYANVSYANNSNSFNTSVQPPLPQPSFDSNQQNVPNEEYNPDSWEIDMSWNSSQEASFNQSMEGPHSPPHYERKGINTNVIEYIEPNLNDPHLTGAGDVDHRQLILPMNGLNAIGAKDRGRLIDVDHRNLISLTGSPKMAEKDSNNDSNVEVS